MRAGTELSTAPVGDHWSPFIPPWHKVKLRKVNVGVSLKLLLPKKAIRFTQVGEGIICIASYREQKVPETELSTSTRILHELPSAQRTEVNMGVIYVLSLLELLRARMEGPWEPPPGRKLCMFAPAL